MQEEILSSFLLESLEPNTIDTDKINIYKNCTFVKAFGYTTFLSLGIIYNSQVRILKFLIYKIKGTMYMIKLNNHQPSPTYN